jgi:acylphosphatase
MALKTVEIIVSGKVQGVFFRQSTRDQARALEIKGHVENLNNGDVKIIASGEEKSLEALYQWCRTGPPHAQVTRVTKSAIPWREFDSFQVVRK